MASLRVLASIWFWMGLCAAHADVIHVCADQAELPPFTYLNRVNAQKTTQITGASVDLLRQIAQQNGWQLDIALLPWARCLAMVESGGMQLALNVERADGLANHLQLSQPYFAVHSVYFYSRRARPQGLKIDRLADLHHYQLCGLLGHRFEPFGVDTQSVDRGTTSYEDLIAKMHAGRCDVFIETREVIAGMYLVDPTLRTLLVDGTLVNRPLPGAPERALYFAISPRASQAAALLAGLNRALATDKQQQIFEHLLDRYLN